jgi:hypothetical protein
MLQCSIFKNSQPPDPYIVTQASHTLQILRFKTLHLLEKSTTMSDVYMARLDLDLFLVESARLQT